MTTIKTQRLQLLALDKLQLQLYLNGLKPLAKELGLKEMELAVEPEFWAEVPDAIEKICLPGVEDHPDRYEWYTHWVMVLQAENRMVGGLGLAGPPNEKGEVQIGYYVDDNFTKQGIATEATTAMIDWVFKNPQAEAIIADTLEHGFASQKVLQKCGFILSGEPEKGIKRWRKDRD